MEPTGPNQKILDSVKKVLALPQNISIYYYAGHGNDICDEITHKPIIKQVPENCIYITISECGVPSILDVIDNPQEKFFRNSNPIHKKLIQYPYVGENKKKLAKALGISDPSVIHIHFPGMNYVESFFQPVNYFDKDESLEIKNDENLEILFMHSGLLDKAKLEANPNPGKNVKADEIETFYISKNEILQKYIDSVYPTQADVNEVLEEKFADKYILDNDDVNMFIVELVNKLKKETLTNTALMEQFPGIHYNMVCRGVSKACDAEAVLQRTLSGQQEIRREQKNIEEFISQRIIFPKQLQANIKKFKKNLYTRKRNQSKKVETKKRR
jgi:hypothetical protein